MPKLTAISPIQYPGKRWLRYTSYSFAAGDAVVPLVLEELPKAAMALPLGFVAQGDAFVPVAVMGLSAGLNQLVAPNGQWLGRYVPAAYRGWPFKLAKAEDGREVLCFDEDSGLLTDTAEGEPFFDDDGKPAKAVAEILDFMNNISANRQATERACAALQKHGLIQPWRITVKSEAGDQNIEGLFQIDEAALNALPAEAFQALREAGALPLVYCQLLSMQHLPVLGQLAEARAKAAEAAKAAVPKSMDELNLEFLNQSGTISFGNLQ